ICSLTTSSWPTRASIKRHFARTVGALALSCGSCTFCQMEMALDTYSHVIPTLQKEVADALEELFGRQMGGNSPKQRKKDGNFSPP
ncbi:MAG: hypothetical protein PWP44_320, partial [Thermacetogenium sp.]|nr:hypothetical protein [Thermacetogenium sp.]